MTAPEPVERGRYAVFEAPDGSWHVARSTTCDDCRDHGCGEQGDPIVVPAMVIALAKRAANGDGVSPMKLLKGLAGRGG
jgi:hypothetical protein